MQTTAKGAPATLAGLSTAEHQAIRAIAASGSAGPTTPVSRWLARHPRFGLPVLLLVLFALWGLAGAVAPPLDWLL